MKNFYYRTFIAGGEKFTFVPSARTPLKMYRNHVDLCNTSLTIPYTEMETAISQLQTVGEYNGFNVREYVIERERKNCR